MTRALKRTLWAVSILLLLLALTTLVLFLCGFRFRAEGVVHSFWRRGTHFASGEYDFWLDDVLNAEGAPAYGMGHKAVKQYGFLHREVAPSERLYLIDEYGELVGSLTRYEGEEKSYYFIHWSQSVTGVVNGKYQTAMRYFTDTIELNGKEISLRYSCFFTFGSEIESLVIGGKQITSVRDYEKPPVSLYAPRPEGSSLEFWITEDVGNVDFSEHSEIYGWMGAREFYGKGYAPSTDEDGRTVPPRHYVSYHISAYPDYADGGKYVTAITITDPTVTVYGLTVNSSFEEYDAVFRDMGYVIEVKETAGGRWFIAKKYGDISFYFDEDAGNGDPKLTIRATVSNRDGIVF